MPTRRWASACRQVRFAEDDNPCSRKAAEQDDFEEVGGGSIDEVFE